MVLGKADIVMTSVEGCCIGQNSASSTGVIFYFDFPPRVDGLSPAGGRLEKLFLSLFSPDLVTPFVPLPLVALWLLVCSGHS